MSEIERIPVRAVCEIDGSRARKPRKWCDICWRWEAIIDAAVAGDREAVRILVQTGKNPVARSKYQ